MNINDQVQDSRGNEFVSYRVDAHTIDTEELGANWIGSFVRMTPQSCTEPIAGKLVKLTWPDKQALGFVLLDHVPGLSKHESGPVMSWIDRTVIVELIRGDNNE